MLLLTVIKGIVIVHASVSSIQRHGYSVLGVADPPDEPRVSHNRKGLDRTIAEAEVDDTGVSAADLTVRTVIFILMRVSKVVIAVVHSNLTFRIVRSSAEYIRIGVNESGDVIGSVVCNQVYP